jgi:UDP-3-O-[3-hydroxymyristoyl] glucosamine N-acyltransferase
MKVQIDKTAHVDPSTRFEGEAWIGFHTCVGYDATPDDPVRIGDKVRIGAFCLIEGGTQIRAGAQVEHYCRVSCGTRIGARTRVLYRAQLYDEVQVGEDCIIAGELVDRTIVEDGVRFQGETAHSHTDATGDWDESIEPSPVIKRDSVVGVGAILIGGITVGPRAFIGAGERVTCDVPEGMVLQGGKLWSLSDMRGMIKLKEH